MKIARRMPNASCRIFAIGARQCTVEDALETMRCAGWIRSSLTPMTAVMSGASSGGASRITRRAPAARCASASARVRPRDVASRTVSTPSSPQRGTAGWSFPDEQRDAPASDDRACRSRRRRSSGKAAQQRVEPQEVGQTLRLREVADGADPDVVARVENSEEVAADAAEAEDPDGRHGVCLPHRAGGGKKRGTNATRRAAIDSAP